MEMIVCIAIIGAISAILFPVFSAARGASQRAVCISNLHQIAGGTQLYISDYDDRLMPVSHHPGEDANSRNDRTWVQSLLPYVRSFGVFRCPSDNSGRPKLEATFDQDLVPGDTYSQFYTASQRSNYGYNYQNLSPVVLEGNYWMARPRSVSEITSLASTILYLDSVWDHTDGGSPAGGGNWLVVPPCRYYPSQIDSFTGTTGYTRVYTPVVGWSSAGGRDAQPYALGELSRGSLYGNAWPWHGDRLNVAQIDGSVHSVRVPDLGVGCDVKDQWQGTITDALKYPWDVR